VTKSTKNGALLLLFFQVKIKEESFFFWALQKMPSPFSVLLHDVILSAHYPSNNLAVGFKIKILSTPLCRL
jgi:hypothetical protein